MYSDYKLLFTLIEASDTSHSGLRTLSLLITAEYSAWEWYSYVCVPSDAVLCSRCFSPIITFIVILLLPSTLTFITLLIHRVRAARAARLERAPEDIVNNLPILIWTGKCWEHHNGKENPTMTPPAESTSPTPTSDSPSTSAGITGQGHPWFEQQVECAICLSEFATGDRVRILPCQHIFHLEEVDEWLIQRKKLVSMTTSLGPVVC
jgi:E3 ubiquitin-protein ligase RNF13/E3 ubiquitin-protein ligase RNF167